MAYRALNEGYLAGAIANLQTNPKYTDEIGITPALNPEDIKGVFI